MSDILSFFSGDALFVALTTVFVAIAEIIFYKLKDKIPSAIVNYAPFIITIAAAVICGAVFKGEAINEKYFSAGIIAYSLGTVIAVAIKKAFRGEKDDAAIIFMINSILNSVCEESAAAEIAEILISLSGGNEEELYTAVTELIKKHLKKKVSDDSAKELAKTIIISTKNILNGK